VTADHVLAIDQGTTSSRAIVFDGAGRPAGVGQRELEQLYPREGWVEHDPERIWADTLAVCREALQAAGLDAGRIAAIGITNQRETTVLWDREDGAAVHKAIVWQDRRTAPLCRELQADGLEGHVQARTGLVIDPYFSATKLAWLLDNVKGARARAEAGRLAFGTIDCFLLWRLTGGRVHATDASNASRTMLFDIHRQDWDEALLERLRIPRAVLPTVVDNSGLLGTTPNSLLGAALPVTGMAGDQQAATFGQVCFEPGMLKSTYGTGCFALLNVGGEPALSRNRLLSTIAWRIGGSTTFALEGSIFVAGAAIQWLRDGLGLIRTAAESEALASSVEDTGGVRLVPAFTGLGAPHWDPEARGALFGLTRGSSRAHVVRAALEATAYQTADLLTAMTADLDAAGAHTRPTAVRVDGGMVANDWLCRFLADVLGLPVERPEVTETTALGAAYLAGLAAGVYPSREALTAIWRAERRFEPGMDEDRRRHLLAAWHDAVRRTRSTF
jgi:glycerol kinase